MNEEQELVVESLEIEDTPPAQEQENESISSIPTEEAHETSESDATDYGVTISSPRPRRWPVPTSMKRPFS